MVAHDLNIEEFPQLLSYLKERGAIGAAEQPVCTALPGGVSNRTVLVERTRGESFVLKQALERLRVATEWRSDPRRIEREALGLEWLAKLAPAGTITPLLFLDKERHLLAMAAVPQPHVNWKTLLLRGEVEDKHLIAFGQLLGCVHATSQERAPELGQIFADWTFFRTLRLEPYYLYTAERLPAAAQFLRALVSETQLQRVALVHGDYSPKNVLVHDGKLILLDHEVIHFGDPAFDLGFSLTHFLSKAHHLLAVRSRLLQGAILYWESYRKAALSLVQAAGFESRVVRHTLACLLARVHGRSPLEYLSPSERLRQSEVVLQLLPDAAAMQVAEVIGRFGQLLT